MNAFLLGGQESAARCRKAAAKHDLRNECSQGRNALHVQASEAGRSTVERCRKAAPEAAGRRLLHPRQPREDVTSHRQREQGTAEGKLRSSSLELRHRGA